MLKDSTIKTMETKSKRTALAPYIFLIFTAVAGLALAFTAVVSHKQTNAGSLSPFDQKGTDPNGATKQKILDWMAKNSSMPDHVLAKIYNAAAVTGNRDLILAICLVESNFNPHVESDRGAIGLMGIMPGVWMKELKEQGIISEKADLYKISGNIAAGSHVLATYLSETNDLRLALVRYVGGASWYATRVLEAEKQIRLAQYADQQPGLSSIIQN
ncbi:MAG: transglycosylase SLT domain-containing protein [Nitrospirae bacterium]|nr:transglycosylase SLT domain-containing protein [Nitrospirota bacterium]